jgi:hypothetical protein
LSARRFAPCQHFSTPPTGGSQLLVLAKMLTG